LPAAADAIRKRVSEADGTGVDVAGGAAGPQEGVSAGSSRTPPAVADLLAAVHVVGDRIREAGGIQVESAGGGAAPEQGVDRAVGRQGADSHLPAAGGAVGLRE